MKDMTDKERRLMQEHVAYWRGLMAEGKVIAFGPVADPKWPYGIALLRLRDDADPQTLGADDPTILADAGFRFEIYPMPSVVLPEASSRE